MENIKTKYRYGQKVMVRTGYFYSGYKGIITSATKNTEEEITYSVKLEGVKEELQTTEKDIIAYKKYIIF
jgi:hypothetical protein